MGVYQFHGIRPAFFKISKETYKAFLYYLKAHQDKYWVATFQMGWIMLLQNNW
ncbi:MAG: Peptidoglycan/xylan/chitin deacetylase, PgdA/CDA1 family [Ferruginibacter sp.]|nr:Peptidoglycan/xylan/chitin deacetylase, PgdA/CDA1 family [Ferruginibacter sp.]